MNRTAVRAPLVAVGLGASAVAAANAFVLAQARGRITTVSQAPAPGTVIVLGAQVRDDWPLRFLAARLDVTAALFHEGKADRVIVSGNADGNSGDEIVAMTEYLVSRGVDRESIAPDPLGLRTYETCRRAREVFGVGQALIVTQPFHLARSVALANAFGIDCTGVPSPVDASLYMLIRNTAREWLAARPRAALDLVRLRAPRSARPGDGTITA